MESNTINTESLFNRCLFCGALCGSIFGIKLFSVSINDQEKNVQLPLTKTGYDTKIMEWKKKKNQQKKQEDKTVMKTRLPGETDASNTLGSKGIRLEKRNQAILTEYTVHILWRVRGTTVSTQSNRSPLSISRKGYKGELKRKKMNTGMVFAGNVAITSTFIDVRNPS